MNPPGPPSRGSAQPRVLERIYLPGAALLAVLILLPSLLYPFGRDQSVFAYVGSVIAEGGMPFRDAWDLKPPGLYALYGLMAAAAPDRGFGLMLLVRVVDIAFAAVTAVLLAVLARRWGRPEAGLAAAAWYAALYLQGGYWSLAQAEGFANPLLAGAACLCLTARGRVPPYLAAGLLTGAAATLKITTFVPIAVFMLWGLRQEADRRALRALAFAAGAAISLGAALLWLRGGGALDAYLDIQRGFVAPYTRLNSVGLLDRTASGAGGLGRWALQVWGPLLLGAGLCWSRQRTPTVVVLALVAAAAAVVVQNKFFLYHWETVLPWLALLAGLGAVSLLERVSARRLIPLVLVLPLIWSLIGRWSSYWDAALLAAGRLPRQQWLARFTSGPDYSFAATLEAAEYVHAHTAAGDRALVWGFEPGVYLFANRRPPTRFFFNVPVAVSFAPKAWKGELLSDLRRDPPELFIVLRRDAIPWANGLTEDSAEQLRAWPDLLRFLESYRFETQIEDFAIYRREANASPTVAR